MEIIKPFRGEVGVSAFTELLQVYIDEHKESLVNAKGDEVLKLQGAITELKAILIDIKRDLPQNNFKNGAYNL
jgi:hypothetical protein